MSDIKRGDVVVCIDAKPDDLDPLAYKLVERRLYRVGTAGVRDDGQFALAFHDVPSEHGRGWAFCARRFRKLPKAGDVFARQMRELKLQRVPQPA